MPLVISTSMITPLAVPAVFDVSHCQKSLPPATTFVRPNFLVTNAREGVVVLLNPTTVSAFKTATGALFGKYGCGLPVVSDAKVDAGALPRQIPRIRAGSAAQIFTLLSAVSKNTNSPGCEVSVDRKVAS